jgi:drug/metabolite transporter (DMT)-like permease
MHALLRTLFAPLLNILEKGDEPYGYKPSHRKILLAVGTMFLFLAGVSLFFGMIAGGVGAFVPAVVFFLVSVVCIVVGAVGSERAVAKLWGSRP